LGAFAACQPISARADDTSAEIRLLKERLKQLEERVAEQGRKEKQTQEKLRQQAAQQPAPPPGGPGPYPYPVAIGVPPQPGHTKGIVPRQEDIPLTIDAQYVPGFVWQRTPQIRLVKDFDYNISAAISAENPATTFGIHSSTADPSSPG
jgi:hypothetical protein